MEKKSNLKVFMFLHLLLFMYSLESVCSKMAAQQELFSFKFFLFYGLVLFLLFFYALAWQRVLKYLPLTVAYANKGITIVWGVIWGAILFHETITLKTIIGGIIILAGIYMVVTNNEH
ncbi:MAG: EamA family transporter [Lachnospiraceae bacterium]